MCAKIKIETAGSGDENNVELNQPQMENGAQPDGAASDEAVASESTQEASGSEAEQAPQQPSAAGAPGDRAAEYLEMAQRLKAEFENYRRRTTREKQDTIRYATEEMCRKLIPVVDNMQRGLTFARDNGLDMELLKGIEMVERQLLDLLADYGVQPYDSLNQPFDPNIHEPMYTMERNDVEENTVVEEAVRGYMMHDRALRLAQVVVSRRPAEGVETGGE